MIWLGILIGLVIAALIGALDNLTHSTDHEHDHDWQIAGAHQMFNVHRVHGIALEPAEEGEPFTEVLWRCGCGAVQTEPMDGHWTFEQLTGTPEAPPSTEFCGFESLHGPHGWAINKQCPGSEHLTEKPNASGRRSDEMAGGDNPDAATNNRDY